MGLPKEQIHYVDLPELAETFADSLGMIFFDGQTARIEFCVTRLNDPAEVRPPKKQTAKKYPCCRLVLTPEALSDLIKNLNQFATAMQQQGKMAATPPAGTTEH